jgi:hypothetical protein
MPDLNINAMTGDEVKQHILTTLNFPADPIHELTDAANWAWLRGSKPWVYTQSLTAEEEDRANLNDGDHILLFPQDKAELCPRSWIVAAWPYLERFRSNFSFFPKEAEFYYHVTLIGKPTGNRYGISTEIEDILRSEARRKVTRIECTNAEELSAALDRRIQVGRAFLEE